MLERLKVITTHSLRMLFGHRAMYLGLSLIYVLAYYHVSDVIVYGGAAGIYLTMAIRG